MTQAATTSSPEVFHPDALAALAALASGRDDQPAWHERALCAQTDPEAFFPEKGSSTREAKQICGRCPVRTECLEDALRRDERFGVWGATSEAERRVLRRARTAADPARLGDPPAPEPMSATVPEQRMTRTRQGRESVPSRGGRGGSRVAGTLPTEPRGHRDQPARASSTFPARARSASENTSPVTARSSATRASARGSRAAQRSTRANAERVLSVATAPPAAAAAPPEADTDRDAAPSAAAADAVARARRFDHECEQDQQRELREVAKLVLAGQHACDGAAGADLTGLDEVDVDRVLVLIAAMTAGSSIDQRPATRPELWERRVAAVAAVLSETLTRGQTGRALQEKSQDVSHWVRRHLEGIELLDTDEHPERDQLLASAQPRVGEQ